MTLDPLARLAFTPDTPTETQRQHGIDLDALCEAIWAHRPSASCLAYLRVQSGGRVRELILGRESLTIDKLVLLDWERAPLAGVFLANELGDDYDLEIDDGRTVEGTVLGWAILRTRSENGQQSLAEIDDGEVCLRRVDGEWTLAPSLLRRALPLRELALRSRPISAQIMVELDEVQRSGVELEPERSLLILGEAGFGKTTVALHRVAHLRAQALAVGQMFAALVLVPTQGLVRLVTALLDRLDVHDVEIRSFTGWVAARGRQVFDDLPTRDSQHAPLAVSRVKRHPALRVVLPEIIGKTAAMREVETGYREVETVKTAEQLLHLFGDRALLERVAAAADGALTPRMLDQVIAHTKVLFSATTEHALGHVDAERLRTVDGRAIDEGTPMHDAETIDVEDFAVLFELLHSRGQTPANFARYDHIVVDEAQEFAPIELAVIGRALAAGGSITVAGDERQQVDETIAFTNWPRVIEELGVGDRCTQLELELSYRCPPAVERFARGLFGALTEQRTATEFEPALTMTVTAHELELVTVLVRALLELRAQDRRASVAVVARFAASARRFHAHLGKALDCRLVVDGDFRFGAGISVTCVDEVKGLEFDYVIVPDASAANYPDTSEARRALYVATTRATARLWLLWSGRASPLLQHTST
jgi:DNA helicase-2/ATP-dependent DNA helicase PcrA